MAKTHGDHCSQVSSSSVNFSLINGVSAVADPGFSIFVNESIKEGNFLSAE